MIDWRAVFALVGTLLMVLLILAFVWVGTAAAVTVVTVECGVGGVFQAWVTGAAPGVHTYTLRLLDQPTEPETWTDVTLALDGAGFFPTLFLADSVQLRSADDYTLGAYCVPDGRMFSFWKMAGGLVVGFLMGSVIVRTVSA